MMKDLESMENNADLKSLEMTEDEAKLAERIRQAEHPQMNAVAARKQRQGVMAIAREMRRPKFTWSWRMAPAALVIVALLVTVFVALSPASGARVATLMDVTGVVEVASDINSQDWQVVNDGFELTAGMHLRTRMDSAVTLVFHDGSRTSVDPESDLVLTDLAGEKNGALQVAFDQYAGNTTHSVVPLRGGSSFFRVNTPAGQANVHGTIFSVDVENEQAWFVVERGEVEVSTGQGNVTLTAGQATISDADTPPDAPAYEFNLQGEITAMTATSWTVQGVTVTLGEIDFEDMTYSVGNLVFVRGRILADGTWVADRVSLARNDREKAHFTGMVERIGADSWQIGGKTLLIDANTEIAENLSMDIPVEVSFVVLEDGQWLALEISQAEDEDEDEITPTPGTATPTPATSPTPSTTLTPEPTAEVDDRGVCSHEKQHPTGLKLAQRYAVTYEEIMVWFCQGYGFGEIDLAYEMSLTSGISVEEIFAMRAGGLGWGTIKQDLTPKGTKEPKVTKEPKKATKEPKEIKPTKTPKPKNK